MAFFQYWMCKEIDEKCVKTFSKKYLKEKKKGNRRSFHSSDGDSDKETRRKVKSMMMI